MSVAFGHACVHWNCALQIKKQTNELAHCTSQETVSHSKIRVLLVNFMGFAKALCVYQNCDFLYLVSLNHSNRPQESGKQISHSAQQDWHIVEVNNQPRTFHLDWSLRSTALLNWGARLNCHKLQWKSDMLCKLVGTEKMFIAGHSYNC